MPVFAYVARDNTGKMVEGDVTAASPVEAAKLVRNEGRFVVKVTARGKATKAAAAAAAAPTARTSNFFNKKKFRPDDLIFFTRQLAVMTETGVSMSEALEACRHDGNSPRFAEALDGVIERVEGGGEFSAALAEHPEVFPNLYVSLVKASEASGMMAPILRRLADHIQDQAELKKKIKSAVTYPIVMFVFAIGVTIFLMTFVLPKFNAIYAGREDKLPVLTRYLLLFSDNLMTYGLYFFAFVVIGGGSAVYYFLTPAGRIRLDAIKLAMPLVGPMYHKTYLARSLRTLGTMIQAGVSMLDSVRLTSGVCGSPKYEAMWKDVNERLERGQQLSESLVDYKQVPKAINKMLGAGERSGRLGTVMENVSHFCEAELNVAIKTMTSLIEPAIVMFLGVVVGGLVLALLLPIFTISKAMH
ncbi:hypothetical protein B7486_04570 [cyanobacterium TDX16]|nr:hypothetical protein B7486_04570 [cyanobacterium TDX16]